MNAFDIVEKLFGMLAIVLGSFLLAVVSKHINVPTSEITFAHIVIVLPFFALIALGGFVCLKD